MNGTGNKIGENGVSSLAEGLRKNASLEILNLQGEFYSDGELLSMLNVFYSD
jgi:hypothetical protein